MKPETKEYLDKFIEKFLSAPVVKEYCELKQAIADSPYLSKLQTELKEAQKELALSIDDQEEHAKKLEKYQSLSEKFESDPLVNNYKVLEVEVQQLLKEIEKTLK